MTTYNNDQKRQIIYSHYEKPVHFKEFKDATSILDHSKTGCADDLVLNVKLKNDILVDATFNGIGCSIFMASCDLVIETLLNKDLKTIKKIIDNYEDMVFKSNAGDDQLLGQLMVFENVKTHLNRVECATIITRAMKKALKFE